MVRTNLRAIIGLQANFSQTQLTEAIFVSSNIYKANFHSANLSDAYF